MPAAAWATLIIAALIIAITAVGLLRVIFHLRAILATARLFVPYGIAHPFWAAASVGAAAVLYAGGFTHPARLRAAGLPVADTLVEAVELAKAL